MGTFEVLTTVGLLLGMLALGVIAVRKARPVSAAALDAAANPDLPQDRVVLSTVRAAAEPNPAVRVAMGPIVGAIVLGNLLTAVIAAILYALFH